MGNNKNISFIQTHALPRTMIRNKVALCYKLKILLRLTHALNNRAMCSYLATLTIHCHTVAHQGEKYNEKRQQHGQLTEHVIIYYDPFYKLTITSWCVKNAPANLLLTMCEKFISKTSANNTCWASKNINELKIKYYVVIFVREWHIVLYKVITYMMMSCLMYCHACT